MELVCGVSGSVRDGVRMRYMGERIGEFVRCGLSVRWDNGSARLRTVAAREEAESLQEAAAAEGASSAYPYRASLP